MSAPEFSRPVRVDTLGAEPRTMTIEADEAERGGGARRFGLVAIDRLAADAALVRDGEEVVATGRIAAAVTQSCVASAEPVAAAVDEPFELRFRPAPAPRPDEEVELGKRARPDPYDGAAIDLGAAVAETLALSLDPYPRAPNAEDALKAAGVKSEEEAGPFAPLAGLRDKMKKD